MLTEQQLEQMRKVDIGKVDKASLVDVKSIYVDVDAPLIERLTQFVTQVKNPYAYKVGEYAVKVEYTPGGLPLSEALRNYLTSLRAGY